MVVGAARIVIDAPPPRHDSTHCSTSNRPAAPIPPPTHMVTTTWRTPRRRPSMRAWPVMRAPDMPKGWPMLIAPPFTFRRSSGIPAGHGSRGPAPQTPRSAPTARYRQPPVRSAGAAAARRRPARCPSVGLAAGHAESSERTERAQPAPCRLGSLHDDAGGGTVESWLELPAAGGAARHDRRERGEPLDGRVRACPLVGGSPSGAISSTKIAARPRRGVTLLAARCVGVLRFARDAVARRDDLGGLDHRRVDLRAVRGEPGFLAHVAVGMFAHAAHRLGAARDHDLRTAFDDGLRRLRDRLQAGGAEAVEGGYRRVARAGRVTD